MMKTKELTMQRSAVFSTLLIAVLVSFMLPFGPQTSEAYLLPPADVMYLRGVVRDFSSTHPDFGITNVVDMGHHVGTVGTNLSIDRRPVATGGGLQVATQWTDQNGNPIAPYTQDPGLPGGHFDVDVYDTLTVDELDHTHEFDDQYNVSFLDLVNDANLLFFDVIGPAYVMGGLQLRMVFENVHNGGGGTFRFDVGAGLVEGTTADGFTAIFDPGLLAELRVDFVSLSALAASDPGDSQDDVVDRNDVFRIRMYDSITNAFVYEITAYHHDQGEVVADFIAGGVGVVAAGQSDACGNPINDIAGVFGVAGTAAITDQISFGEWFRDRLGINQSTSYTISLQRDAYGVYDYRTDFFFPVDGMLLGNEGEPNNNLYTYAISASFTYNSCTGQFFEFESNDDAWTFVDSKLVIDLGGTLTPERQFVDLDRLGLVDGQTYSIDFFFAHRRVALNSLFHMRTNMQIVTGARSAITAFYD